ncbi:solute carrier family 23 protein [Thermosporothrix hazakensis]
MTESERRSYFPRWRLKKEGVVAPDERLPWGQNIMLGIQHVLAMFGSTVVAPILMGFDPNTAIFFSGIGTLIFFLLVGGRVPSYLGSSFAFIAVVNVATHYMGSGPNPNIGVALGGIIVTGAIYALVGLVVMLLGYKWIDFLMPPVVTGAVVTAIGLNLASSAISQASSSAFDGWIAAITVLAVAVVAVFLPGWLRRLPILIGGIIGYIAYVIGSLMGLGPQIDFSKVEQAAWIGLPHFTAPSFSPNAISLIAPVVLILVVENAGHIKAVAAMTGQNIDKYMGRAFLGDGLATMIAGAGGGTGVTTYSENIGAMALSRIYSTLLFVVAAVMALLLSFCPKFGALIQTMPQGVLGGLSIVLFGLIAVSGGRIWIENNVDFSKSRNLMTAGVTLIIGSGMVGNAGITIGSISMGGIGVATIVAIILYQVLRERDSQPDEAVVADSAVGNEPLPEKKEPTSSRGR